MSCESRALSREYKSRVAKYLQVTSTCWEINARVAKKSVGHELKIWTLIYALAKICELWIVHE